MLRFSALALLVTSSAFAADWPGFRGPTGQGVSDESAPLKWSDKEGIAWSVEVPGAGWSSPVVANGKVFVTTATDGGKTCRVLAFDAKTGKPLWDTPVHEQPAKRMEARNSPATPTPVADADRVYAAFNDGTIAAVNTSDGKVAWANKDYPYYSQHGLGNSPVRYADLLVMTYDGSSDGPDKKVGWQMPWENAAIVALDAATGKQRWKASRGKSRIAHATPLVVTHDKKDVLVSPAGDVVQGFDPKTGERLWSVPAEGEGLVPSPSAGDGLAFVTPGFGKPALRAVKLDGGHEVAWQSTKYVSKMPSMVYHAGRLFVVTDKGLAAYLDAKTGKAVWEEKLPAAFSASPVLAGGHLYALADTGETFVLKAADTYELVARNKLGEPAQATPAVADGRLFIRTKTKLWCVGAK